MWTTQDWLARAHDGEDVAACLVEAERAALWPDDWVAAGGAWAEQGERARARRCVDAGLELAAGDHWPTRRAAEMLLGTLEDREGAARAIGRIETRLRQGARAYEWVLLARAHRELFSDEGAVSRCLEAALVTAVEPGDLADLAGGYVEMADDRARAVNLLERAEARALETGNHRELWSIAIRWRESLGDAARARAALTTATERSGDVVTLGALAIAWQSLLADEVAMRGALARAETVADSAADWLRLAEAYRDGGRAERPEPWDPDAIRRCLDAGEAAAPTDAERRQLETAARRWLGNPAQAPPRRPERELAAQREVPGWDHADPRALLEALRLRLGAPALQRIAEADYGHAWTKHLEALEEIHASGEIPHPLDWYPREVLELTRWQQGAAIDHAERAFAAVVLALDYVLPDTQQAGTLPDLVAPLTESAWALGLDKELEQHLAWLAAVIDRGAAWPLFALVLTVARRDAADARLPALIAATDAAEAEELAINPDAGWLLRTTDFTRGHFGLWRVLAGEVLAPAGPLAELAARWR